MFAVAAAVSVLLAALLAWSAARKLSHREDVVRTYTRVGVPEDKLNHLAAVLLVAAAGLLLGLAWAPLGIAAAAGIVLYFAAAVSAHILADDTGNLPMPLGFLMLGVATLALRLASL